MDDGKLALSAAVPPTSSTQWVFPLCFYFELDGGGSPVFDKRYDTSVHKIHSSRLSGPCPRSQIFSPLEANSASFLRSVSGRVFGSKGSTHGPRARLPEAVGTLHSGGRGGFRAARRQRLQCLFFLDWLLASSDPCSLHTSGCRRPPSPCCKSHPTAKHSRLYWSLD